MSYLKLYGLFANTAKGAHGKPISESVCSRGLFLSPCAGVAEISISPQLRQVVRELGLKNQ